MRSNLANPAAPSDTASGAIIVNAWVVADGCQETFIEMIDGLLARIRTLDGFIDGELLQGVNPRRFVSYVRMRSTRDRQRVVDDSEVRALLRAAEGVAHPDVHNYDVLRVFRPPPA